MKRKLCGLLVPVIAAGLLAAAQVGRPERTVRKNVVTSTHDPAAQISVPATARYVGADRWVLYDVADCEIEVFVEAGRQGEVQRLYWIQFEQYLPSRPELQHQYDSPRHATIDGMDFFVDTWVRGAQESTRAGSDREHIEALVRAKGFRMPSGMMYVRLVHLLDPRMRKELMIIYGEDLPSTGFSVADLREGGQAYARWPEIEKDLIARALHKIRISSLPISAKRP